MKDKVCPRCGSKFICNHENILQCQCSKIKLTEKAYKYIHDNYKECLCINCLNEINKITK